MLFSFRGSAEFEFGANCITARREADLTTGFFIALFVKNPAVVSEEPVGNISVVEAKKKKRKNKQDEVSSTVLEKKKRKKNL